MKIYLRIVWTFWFITLFIFNSKSQSFDDNKPSIVIPPSPVASSLFREVNVPVNYYTGTPEINIPLYVVKTGALQMPISVKYNASGIKVEQDAGEVGLGWDLVTGGAIGRAIVGRPDEVDLNDPNGSGYRASATLMQMPAPGNDTATNGWLSRLSSCSLQKISTGKYDLSPDNYFMNFNGNSAKLFFDKNAKPYFSPYKAWKLSGNETDGFKVIIEDGTTYEFKLPENSSDIYETLPQDVITSIQANTSWYLTRIISADKSDTITLNYKSINYTPISYNPTESYSVLISGQVTPSCVPPAAPTISSTTTASHSIKGYILKSIVTKDGRVEIFSNTGRADIQDSTAGMPYKLDSLLIYAIMPNSANVLLKKYIFNYDYYNRGQTSINQRLKLLSISQMGSGNETGDIWQFSYDSTNLLPAKNSKGQDNWGYPNAATNSTLIPTYVDDIGHVWSGADRSTDSTRTISGLLTKIQYPTGGFTSFEYEANRYATNQSGGRDSLLVSISASAKTGSLNATSPTLGSTTITVNTGQYVLVEYNIQEPTLQVGEVEVNILNSAGSSIYYRSTIGNYQENIYLNAGVYTLTASKDPVLNQFGLIRVTWNTKIVSPNIGIIAGGARIKRLLESDGITQVVKRFSYLKDSITSSGIILNQPIYGDYQLSPQYNSGCYPIPGKVGNWRYYTQHSVSTVELGRTQGNFICYSNIKVLSGDNGENGYEEYSFSIKNDAGGNGFPYSPMTSYDDFRGQLLQKKIYSATGKLLEKYDNQYNLIAQKGYPNFNQMYGVKVGFRETSNVFTVDGCPDLLNTGWNCQAKLYSVLQLWPTLASTKKTVYSSSTSDSVETVMQMNYDTLNLQPSVKKTWNSKNDSLTDVYKYPNGFAGTAVYDTMIARNIINPTIENDHYYNVTLQSKALINYQLWTLGSLKLPLPLNKQLQYLSNPLETRLQFLSYDNSSNLLSQQKINDVPNSYIWDYYSHNPIAMVTNAQGGDIAYTSFEFDGMGNWTISSAIRDSINAITGSRSYNLTNGSISKSSLNSAKTFVLSYWSKSGSALVNGSAASSSLTKNGWNYYEHSLSGVTSVTITGTVTIDELRLYPSDAQMTTYTYQPLTGISSVCSSENSIAYYEYDGLQRLVRIRDMDRNILKQYDYRYQVPASTYLNVVKSGTFTKNNCSTGYTGGTLTYTVPAGTYGSSVSQANADQLAVNDVITNGQNYANTNGTCTFQPEPVTGSNSSTESVALTFTNLSTSSNYNFNLNTGAVNVSLGSVPYGSYNITMTPSAPSSTYYLNYNVNTNTQTDYTTVTFSNITITAPVTISVSQAACSITTCPGTNHKCISGVCQTGNLDIISQTYSGGKCTTKWGYFFTDGTYQYDHSTTANGACMQ